MMTRQYDSPGGSAGVATLLKLALEKVRTAADRLAVDRSTVYKMVSAGQIRLVKTGIRGSAVLSEDVDAIIRDRLDAAAQVTKNRTARA